MFSARHIIDYPVVIEFLVPSGEGVGMYVKEYSERKEEFEFTLKRGTNYIISEVDTKDGVTLIKARVVK